MEVGLAGVEAAFVGVALVLEIAEEEGALDGGAGPALLAGAGEDEGGGEFWLLLPFPFPLPPLENRAGPGIVKLLKLSDQISGN